MSAPWGIVNAELLASFYAGNSAFAFKFSLNGVSLIESITFDAINAFGIGSMTKTFSFVNKKTGKFGGRCMAIYAPNGTCKSSIRKSLELWNADKEPEDVFFPERESAFSITTAPDADAIPRGNIFCFESMPALEGMRFFDGELIASPSLKAKYMDYTIRHRKQVDDVLAAIRSELVSGRSAPLPDDMETYICDLTGKGDVYGALALLLERGSSLSAPAFMLESKQDAILKKGYEDKIAKASAKGDIKAYVDARRNALGHSTIFRNGFDPNAANGLLAALEKAHFFEAGHAIVLHDNLSDEDLPPIRSKEELEELFASEFKKATNNPGVLGAYNKVDKAIGSAREADGIRQALCKVPGFAEAASDLDAMKLDFLTCAAMKHKAAVENLLAGKDEYLKTMREINEKANEESTGWDRAIKLFERRFHVPFSLQLANRESAVIEGTEPVIRFSFDGVRTEYPKLRTNLSDGERKALYMLAVIFQVEQAKRADGPRLLVFDDVVDSFDYANKYAFIEYLREFADAPDLYILLLTHNYDFFRTVTSRLDGFSRRNCVIVDKGPGRALEFEPVQFLDANPFALWKGKMGEDAYKVAAVPMVRELVAIRSDKKNDDEYALLSRALHGRNGSGVTFGELHECFLAHWDCSALEGDEERVSDVARRVCRELYERGRSLELQEKVSMALGIRLIVEGCLGRLYDSRHKEMPGSEKMGKLVRDYRENFQEDYAKHGGTAEEAAIITPENIHVNSFMYEPLVDIGSQRFFDLYKRCIDWEREQA